MRNFITFLFFFCYIISPMQSKAAVTGNESVKYSSIQIEDGLSQISVVDIFQDSKGYLWFATRNGLNRYDGRDFKVFRHEKGNPGSLSDNHVTSLAEDNNGNLWIGTRHGLSKLDLSSEKVTAYVDSLAYKMFEDGIRALALDANGRVLIATPHGLFVAIDDDKFESILPEVKGTIVEGLAVTKDGRIFVGTTTLGLYILNKDHKPVKHFNTHNSSLPTDDIKEIYEDSKGNIWLANSSDGMILLDVATGKNKVFNYSNSALPSNNIRCFADDGDQLYIGTSEGVSRMSLKDSDYKIEFETNSLSNFSVYSILIDNAGTRWVGTYSGGVNFYNPISNRFGFHHPVNPTQNYMSIFGSMVYNPDNKLLYIATEGHGLLEYDIHSEKSRFHLIDKSDHQQSKNIIKCLTYIDGKIWCGTPSGEIFIFNPETDTFSLYFKTNKCTIYSIEPDSDGSQWIATTSDTIGIARLKEGKIIEKSFSEAKIAIPSGRVIKKVSKDVWLFGTSRHGLIKYDRNRDEVYQIGNESDLKNAYITSIAKDKNGNSYWIGTFGNGLFNYVPATDNINKVKLSEDDAPVEVCQVVQDNSGNLWICTTEGITSLNPASGERMNYTRTSDIRIQEFTIHSGIALESGEVFFSGSNGFITFNPAEIKRNEYQPPIVFTGLSVNNKPIEPNDSHGIIDSSIDDTGSITLDYNQNNLSISYAALNYINPEQNQYAFMLEGVDDDWVYVGNRREAHYANLAPGGYTFKVKGANNDGVWSTDARSIKIRITPPFWKTWYAYTFYLLALIGISFLIMYYIFKKKTLEQSLEYEQMKQKQAEEFHESKIRMFTNFSHELRTPLTLIVSPLQELLKRTDFNSTVRNKISLIYNNSQRLQLLVNQLMDLHKNQAGQMQLKIAKDDIVPFMQEVYSAFNQIAVANSISFSYVCSETSLPAWFDKSLFEKVAFNLLSNAFKYTKPGGVIEMKVEPIGNDNQLIPGQTHSLPDMPHDVRLVHIAVSDSGRGIPEDELTNIFSPFYQVDDNKSKNIIGTGIGLSLTRSIVELHHGVIWAENNPEKGATFHVIFPIDNSVYTDDEIDHDTDERVVMDVFPPTTPTAEFKVDKRYTVLLVEDNKDVREYVKECLEPYYNVIEAEDGQRGFELTAERYPDIVVSDIMMPVKDGLELCAMIKNDMRTGHIPVILMTARSMVMQIKEGFASGADDYIVKPFNMDILLYRIKNILASREKLRNLYGKQFSPEAMGIEIVSFNDKFTQKFFSIIEKNISNSELNIEFICKEIGLSRANLYRKLKAITELSPMELIRNKRLEVAAKLLLESDSSVSEISTYVGFNSHAYFTNCFKSTYGMSPSDFVAKHKASNQNFEQTLTVEPEPAVSM